MKSSPVAVNALAELSMVNVKIVVLPTMIESGVKTLAKVGGGSTVSESLAVPLLPSDEVRSPVVLTWVPTVLLVTSTCNVQLELAPTEPPV